MAEATQRPIIVRRIKKNDHGGHHGGAWKIAYADFVTAMMAFFLLMWLLGSTSKGELEGIAEYFKNPMRVSMSGGSGSGDSSSLIKGGGQDLTRKTGQVKRGDIEDPKKTVNLKAAQADLERLELGRLQALKSKLEGKVDSSQSLRQFRSQILLDITKEGLRIQIVDQKNRPMFAIGSSALQPYTREILREIALLINDVPNKIALSGHTDATPYQGGERGYSNWELSADRANASRRELIAGGLEDGKIVRVVGLSSAVLFDHEDPLNPINRRISIVVLNKQAEESLYRAGADLEVSNPNELSTDRLSGAAPRS